MIQEARTYLTEALDYIQQHSVMKERVEWAALRHAAFTLLRKQLLESIFLN